MKSIKKNGAYKYVRLGTQNASVLFGNEESKSQLIWPEWKHKSIKSPKLSSQIAAGLLNPITDKKRSSLFSEYLKAEPTMEQLKEELTVFDIPEKTIKALKICRC